MQPYIITFVVILGQHIKNASIFPSLNRKPAAGKGKI